MLDVFDRYKFGIIAAFTTYVAIFMYTNIVTYDYIIPIEPFTEHARILDKEEVLEITPDNIEIPPDYSMDDVKNMSQNVHDNREASYEDFSENRTPEQIAQDIKNLEAQIKQEAGGSADRAELQKLIDQRKKEQELAAQNKKNDNSESGATSNKKYAGTTMVSWDLNGRKAYQNNDWYVRNPGYTCDAANGVVVVNVKTNANGNVIWAEVNEGASRNTTACMKRQALEYAKKSRFEYSSDGGKQTGYIKYTFILK